ncbi:3'-5' exonuclease [Streptomyces sp. NPDC002740]
MNPIAFVDCETTHLDAEIGDAWEVAVILRAEKDGRLTDTEHVWQFAIDRTAADPEALRIGRFRERHLVDPTWGAAWTGPGPVLPCSRESAVEAIVTVLRGAVIVGSNPGFDDRFLRKLLGPGSAQWHYRPYDIVQLAAAKIGAQQAGPLPWSSYALSRAVGVEPPTAEAAHTALGDARWARDVHDAVMIREKFPLSWEGRAQHAIGLYTQTACELDDARRELRTLQATVRTLLSAPDAPQHCHAEPEIWDGGGPCAYCTPLAQLRATLSGPSQPVMTGVTYHYGRAWVGHEIEDACPCIKAPCGLVARSVPECTQHRGDKSTRQSHRADNCPGLEAPNVQEIVAVPRTERSRWVDIANALNAAVDAGMPVGIDLDGTLTDHAAWSVIWDSAAKRWTVAGYDEDDESACTCTVGEACDQCADDDQDEDLDDEDEETGDADGDVFDLISEIAGRLSDATDEGEYHAVGLIADLANGRKTCDEARTELAEITFRHV